MVLYFRGRLELAMPLNVLYESPVGFALFQVLDEGKIKDVSNVENLFSDPSQLSGVLELKKFKKFTDQVEATQAAVSLTEGTYTGVTKCRGWIIAGSTNSCCCTFFV